MNEVPGLFVRFSVRVRVLALVLVCGRSVDDEDDLAADDRGAWPLAAEHERPVASGSTVEQVGIAVRGKRMELVVPGSSAWRKGCASVLLERGRMDADAVRGRTLVEESREAVVVLDEEDRVLLASRRARQSIEGIREGERIPAGLLTGELGFVPLVIRYHADGRAERIVYFSHAGDLAAYEELRAGFTAAVSHELRTPLARLLTLLETSTLPGEDVHALVQQATGEVEQITELIDEVLFLSELESGARVVSLGPTSVRPVLQEALDELAERGSRAGVTLRLEVEEDVELAIRPRMLRVVARNLAENAIRYAGPDATFTLRAATGADGSVVLTGADDGVGVA